MKEIWNWIQVVITAIGGFFGWFLGGADVLRTAIVFFYLSNEGISMLENSAHLGLPIPEKLKDVLKQLHNKSDEEE